jgi:AcrR family transcriptional regulator
MVPVTDRFVTHRDQEGLRERKKRATREALHDAALRLTLDHGLEHLTVEEISAAADVSPRTFFNYFPGKEQAIIGDDLFAADAGRVSEIMAGAPSVLDGMQAIALDLAAAVATRREQVQLRWQVITRYPALITAMFTRLEEFNTIVACAVAARLGCAPDGAYPQLMAAMTTTGIRVAVQRWTTGHGDEPLERHMAEVFGLLKGELAAVHGINEGPRGTTGDGPRGGVS